MTDVSASELDFVQVDRALVERAIEAMERAKLSGLQVVTAESCTGGLVAMVLSEAPGAAEFLDGGFVTYTPQQKCAALKLEPALIETHGAVSAEVAAAMAHGALECSQADIAVVSPASPAQSRMKGAIPLDLSTLLAQKKAENASA